MTTLTIENPEISFNVSPNSNSLRTVVIPVERIAKKPKRNGPKSYLIIGVDTEYQALAPVAIELIRDREIEAQNEILSYQMYVQEISETASSQVVVSEIIIPLSGKRIAIQHFIGFALGLWAESNPRREIPYDVYLVGHFTRADLPSFADFRKNAQAMTNVRNTFVNAEQSFYIKVGEQSLRARLRDTMLLSPGAKSLADLAPIVGEAKIKLADDARAELAIKQNMKDFMLRQPDLFRAYALNDAAIPAKYAEQLIRKNASLTGDFALPVTLTSIGISLILSDWKSKGFEADDILGQKVHFDPKFSSRLGYFKQNTEPAPIDVVYYRLDFVTETYHGGRNEQFMYGIAPEADWYDWDLSGAYTTAMHLIGKPNWKATEKINDTSGICIDDLAYFCVDFEFPPDVRFPVLPVRTPYGLIFPKKGRSNCAAPELLLAKELNAKISIVEAWLVPTDKSTRIFESFIKYCNSQRKKAKTTFDNLLWKELGNSTYGKTAQGLRKKRVYNIQDDEHETLPPSKITNPFFASFITSYVRAVLGEIMNALPRDARVFSVTTDGFLSTATDAYIEQAFKNPIAASFRSARREISGNNSDRGIEMKHLVRQPVGWRTRGSCTFKPHPQKKGSVVLQKGGIKLDGDLTDEQENEIILNLFLDRSPGQKLRYTRGIGLRDMVTYGTDFVQIVAEKSLGMEFDWKRKPMNWANTTAKSPSRTATHLSFETSPLEDFDEFIHYRTQWEAYNKRHRSCLKTTADLEAFNNFLELRMSPKELQRYLKHRDDADVDRLADMIALAYVSRHIMMHRYRLGAELREEFCAEAQSCDIPVTIAKLDHAKAKLRALRKRAGKDAKPNFALCIKTDRVVKALARLKKQFPRLEEKAFFRKAD